MITLHQFEVSPFCDKVRRVLGVKRVPHRVENVSVGAALAGRIRRLSAVGKVPVLDIDGERIADSTTIVRELEARFPTPRLIPEDPRERALAHILEDWADEALVFFEIYLRFALPHNAARTVALATRHDGWFVSRVASRALPRALSSSTRAQGLGRKPWPVIERELASHFDQLDAWLGDRAWLVGGQLSIADIAVFVQLDCMAATDEGRRLLSAHERIGAWMARVDMATRS